MGAPMKYFFLIIWLLCSSAFADGPTPVFQKQEIPNAVTVSLTPSGQKFWGNQIDHILKMFGYNLAKGAFPEGTYGGKQDIDLDDLERRYPEPGKLIKQFRGLLTDWLVGLQLNPHRPAFQVGESEYAAELTQLSMLPDQQLMTQLGLKDGAVLVVEFKMKKLVAAAAYAKIKDLNNPDLGEVGLEEVSIKMGSDESPLFIRIPVYVKVNQQGDLQFQVISFDQNISEVPVEIKYKSLITPKLVVKLNGKEYPLNTKKIDELFNQHVPDIMAKAREYITDFAKTDLPSKLDAWAAENFIKKIEEVQYMPPPGDPRNPPVSCTAEEKALNDTSDYYLWGIVLKKLFLNNDLNIDFSAYVEDPMARRHAPIDPRLGARGKAPLAGEKIPHDLGVSLDRAVINRVLQHSFNRGYFEKVSQDDGTFIKLAKAPVVDYVPARTATKPTETYMKITVDIAYKPTGASAFVIKNPSVIGVDIITKLVPNDCSDFEIQLIDIDPNSIRFDKSNLTLAGRLLPFNTIMNGIKSELAKTTAPWKTKKTILPGTFSILPKFPGYRMDLQKVSFSPSGHILMYLNFQIPNVTTRSVTR
jgi:hypothetical protein